MHSNHSKTCTHIESICLFSLFNIKIKFYTGLRMIKIISLQIGTERACCSSIVKMNGIMQNQYIFKRMGCCVSKPKKRPATATSPATEKRQTSEQSNPIVLQKSSLTDTQKKQIAKQWQREGQSQPQNLTVAVSVPKYVIQNVDGPANPSRRKQLLKKLFEQARAKSANSPMRVRKAQSLDSQQFSVESKGKGCTKVEDAIKEVLKGNMEDVTSCSICTELFDSQSRIPTMICMNQHTFCSVCIRDLWDKGYRKCPLDQNAFDIQKIRKNRLVLQIIKNIQITTTSHD